MSHYTEACELARSTGDEKRLGGALNGVAEIHRGSGDLAAAEPFYREAIRLSPQNPRGKAVTLINLAGLLIATGRPAEARAALAESRSLSSVIGYKSLVECAIDVGVAAALASTLGEHPIAARLHGAMLKRLHEVRVRQDLVDEAFIAARIADSRAAMGEAAFDAAKAEGWALSYDASVAELDRWLGVIRRHVARGERDDYSPNQPPCT
jgi:tetratricopeptide (TPR) repeat protein